ncbi:MAG: CtsR family transcriptional regulator [Clostridia bacterium]|nr:CtsR family transcriptional regulator [Clostridia bacterium]
MVNKGWRWRMRISDAIERFIKAMLEEEEQEVELKRNELAAYFGCVPSQINYVLSTRFTVDHGYITESRRGGGGYIRITRMKPLSAGQYFRSLLNRIGESIGELEASRLIKQLADGGIINLHQAKMLSCAISASALSVPLPPPVKDALRARILRCMLVHALQDYTPPYEMSIRKEMNPNVV